MSRRLGTGNANGPSSSAATAPLVRKPIASTPAVFGPRKPQTHVPPSTHVVDHSDKTLRRPRQLPEPPHKTSDSGNATPQSLQLSRGGSNGTTPRGTPQSRPSDLSASTEVRMPGLVDGWLDYDEENNKNYYNIAKQYAVGEKKQDRGLYIGSLTTWIGGLKFTGLGSAMDEDLYHKLFNLFYTAKPQYPAMERVEKILPASVKLIIGDNVFAALEKKISEAKDEGGLNAILGHNDNIAITQFLAPACRLHNFSDSYPFNFRKYIVLCELEVIKKQLEIVKKAVSSRQGISGNANSSYAPDIDLRYLFNDTPSLRDKFYQLPANKNIKEKVVKTLSYAVRVFEGQTEALSKSVDGSLNIALTQPSVRPFEFCAPGRFQKGAIEKFQSIFSRDQHLALVSIDRAFIHNVYGPYGGVAREAKCLMGTGAGKSHLARVLGQYLESLDAKIINAKNFTTRKKIEDFFKVKEILEDEKAVKQDLDGVTIVIDEDFFYSEQAKQAFETGDNVAEIESRKNLEIKKLHNRGAIVISSGTNINLNTSKAELDRLFDGETFLYRKVINLDEAFFYGRYFKDRFGLNNSSAFRDQDEKAAAFEEAREKAIRILKKGCANIITWGASESPTKLQAKILRIRSKILDVEDTISEADAAKKKPAAEVLERLDILKLKLAATQRQKSDLEHRRDKLVEARFERAKKNKTFKAPEVKGEGEVEHVNVSFEALVLPNLQQMGPGDRIQYILPYYPLAGRYETAQLATIQSTTQADIIIVPYLIPASIDTNGKQVLGAKMYVKEGDSDAFVLKELSKESLGEILKKKSDAKILSFFGQEDGIGGDHLEASVGITKQIYHLPNTQDVTRNLLMQCNRNRTAGAKIEDLEYHFIVDEPITADAFWKQVDSNTKKDDEARRVGYLEAKKSTKGLDTLAVRFMHITNIIFTEYTERDRFMIEDPEGFEKYLEIRSEYTKDDLQRMISQKEEQLRQDAEAEALTRSLRSLAPSASDEKPKEPAVFDLFFYNPILEAERRKIEVDLERITAKEKEISVFANANYTSKSAELSSEVEEKVIKFEELGDEDSQQLEKSLKENSDRLLPAAIKAFLELSNQYLVSFKEVKAKDLKQQVADSQRLSKEIADFQRSLTTYSSIKAVQSLPEMIREKSAQVLQLQKSNSEAIKAVDDVFDEVAEAHNAVTRAYQEGMRVREQIAQTKGKITALKQREQQQTKAREAEKQRVEQEEKQARLKREEEERAAKQKALEEQQERERKAREEELKRQEEEQRRAEHLAKEKALQEAQEREKKEREERERQEQEARQREEDRAAALALQSRQEELALENLAKEAAERKLQEALELQRVEEEEAKRIEDEALQLVQSELQTKKAVFISRLDELLVRVQGQIQYMAEGLPALFEQQRQYYEDGEGARVIGEKVTNLSKLIEENERQVSDLKQNSGDLDFGDYQTVKGRADDLLQDYRDQKYSQFKKNTIDKRAQFLTSIQSGELRQAENLAAEIIALKQKYLSSDGVLEDGEGDSIADLDSRQKLIGVFQNTPLEKRVDNFLGGHAREFNGLQSGFATEISLLGHRFNQILNDLRRAQDGNMVRLKKRIKDSITEYEKKLQQAQELLGDEQGLVSNVVTKSKSFLTSTKNARAAIERVEQVEMEDGSEVKELFDALRGEIAAAKSVTAAVYEDVLTLQAIHQKFKQPLIVSFKQALSDLNQLANAININYTECQKSYEATLAPVLPLEEKSKENPSETLRDSITSNLPEMDKFAVSLTQKASALTTALDDVRQRESEEAARKREEQDRQAEAIRLKAQQDAEAAARRKAEADAAAAAAEAEARRQAELKAAELKAKEEDDLRRAALEKAENDRRAAELEAQRRDAEIKRQADEAAAAERAARQAAEAEERERQRRAEEGDAKRRALADEVREMQEELQNDSEQHQRSIAKAAKQHVDEVLTQANLTAQLTNRITTKKASIDNLTAVVNKFYSAKVDASQYMFLNGFDIFDEAQDATQNLLLTNEVTKRKLKLPSEQTEPATFAKPMKSLLDAIPNILRGEKSATSSPQESLAAQEARKEKLYNEMIGKYNESIDKKSIEEKEKTSVIKKEDFVPYEILPVVTPEIMSFQTSVGGATNILVDPANLTNGINLLRHSAARALTRVRFANLAFVEDAQNSAAGAGQIFGQAIMHLANFQNCEFVNVDLSQVKDLHTVKFAHCKFVNCKFNEEVLQQMQQKDAFVKGCVKVDGDVETKIGSQRAAVSEVPLNNVENPKAVAVNSVDQSLKRIMLPRARS